MSNESKVRSLKAQRARQLVHYIPDPGTFRWKVSRGKYWCAGKIAGTIRSDGYRQLCVDGILIRANRLAYLIMEGKHPPIGMHIDHIDHDRSNDAWDNLRVCTPLQNCRNRNPVSNNSSGRTGVCWDKTKQMWNAYIGLNSRTKNLGYFKQQADAIAARVAAERELYGAFAGSAGAS